VWPVPRMATRPTTGMTMKLKDVHRNSGASWGLASSARSAEWARRGTRTHCEARSHPTSECHCNSAPDSNAQRCSGQQDCAGPSLKHEPAHGHRLLGLMPSSEPRNQEPVRRFRRSPAVFDVMVSAAGGMRSERHALPARAMSRDSASRAVDGDTAVVSIITAAGTSTIAVHPFIHPQDAVVRARVPKWY